MPQPSSDRSRPRTSLAVGAVVFAVFGLAHAVAASTVELLCAPDIPTAKLSVQLDWEGGDCRPGGPGQPGNLVGFAFPFVNSQAAGDITRIRMFFIEPTVASLNVYLWRDASGSPDDTCGNERLKLLHAPIAGDSVYSEYLVDPPLALGLGETVWLGAVYESAAIPPTWYIGRITGPSQPGRALANLTGDHGDWFDLDDFGYGQCYGVRLELEVNFPPTAATGGPYCGRTGTGIAFDGRGSSDPDGDPLTYHWDLGDGATATGATPVHAYATAGAYPVVLTVSDTRSAATDTTIAAVDIPATVRVPDDMTLPAALALAGRCAVDTIQVAAGSYEGPFTLSGSDAVLLAVDGAQSTELVQIESQAPVLRVSSGHPRIEGFTIHGSGPGLRLESAAEIIACHITDCGGSGIEVDAPLGARITQCVIANNSIIASDGGGVEVAGMHEVTLSTIHGNGGFGVRSRFHAGGPSDTVIDRCLITATRLGPAFVCQAGAEVTVSCSDIWANAGGDAICGRNAGENLSLDPLYCDPDSGDLSLRADSPCLAVPNCGGIGALGQGCTLTESRISGRLSGPGGALAGITVHAIVPATGAVVASSATESDGAYALTALGAGAYVIEALPSGTLFMGQYYPALPSYLPENLMRADRVVVNGADQVSGIDFSLAIGGSMRGRVVDESNGMPLAAVPVHPFPLGGELWRPTVTNENGVFETVPLPTGQYGALTPGIEGFFGEVYRERMNPAAADPIYVFAGQRVLNVDFTLLPGAASVENGPAPPATPLALDPPVPNPFNPSTRIRFHLRAAGQARLDVFDIHGRHVRSLLDGVLMSGEHEVRWDGRNDAARSVPSGIYLVRLESQGRAVTREAVLLR